MLNWNEALYNKLDMEIRHECKATKETMLTDYYNVIVQLYVEI